MSCIEKNCFCSRVPPSRDHCAASCRNKSSLGPGPELDYRFDLYRENYLGFWQILTFLAGAEKQANRLLLLDCLILQRGKDTGLLHPLSDVKEWMRLRIYSSC
eukprot:09934_3